jgi:F0F1-type ATP synthase assembly protein I
VLAQRPLIDPETKNMWRIAGTTGAVGIEIAVAIVIGYLGGSWLDHKFGTTPWLTCVGFFSGVGAAVKAIVRVTRQYKRGLDENETKKSPRNRQ